MTKGGRGLALVHGKTWRLVVYVLLEQNGALHFRLVHGRFTREEGSCSSGHEALNWRAALGRCR